MGKDGFIWWQGVVEDRNDPLKLGRCRVRILGWHPESKQAVPTNTLPWAHPLMPITSASMQGIGESPTGPVEGTWVMGFFRDGEDAQEPVMMGTIGGIPESVSPGNKEKTNVGFGDPRPIRNANKPKKDFYRQFTKEEIAANGPFPSGIDYPLHNKLNEPDTNRLARSETLNKTIVQTKLTNRTRDVAKGWKINTFTIPTYSWSETPTPYDAKYPYNRVFESESGHIREIDDTPGNERIAEYHKSGTFSEIGPRGSKVVKVVANNYTIIAGTDHVYIQGYSHITVDEDATIYVKKNAYLRVDGNLTANVTGNYTEHVEGNMRTTVSGTKTTIVAKKTTETYNSGLETNATKIALVKVKKEN